jgi:hypothetical protein
MQEVPVYRRPVARLHGWLGVHLPVVFGGLNIKTRKPSGNIPPETGVKPFSALLRSPINGKPVALDPARNLWVDVSATHGFPNLNGIPVLIADDAVELTGTSGFRHEKPVQEAS